MYTHTNHWKFFTSSELVARLKVHGIVNLVENKKIGRTVPDLGIPTKYSEDLISQGWIEKC